MSDDQHRNPHAIEALLRTPQDENTPPATELELDGEFDAIMSFLDNVDDDQAAELDDLAARAHNELDRDVDEAPVIPMRRLATDEPVHDRRRLLKRSEPSRRAEELAALNESYRDAHTALTVSSSGSQLSVMRRDLATSIGMANPLVRAPELTEAPTDAELITAVRGGDTAAYGVLYERHLHAAKRAAFCLSNRAAEREDLVADAFTRVLRLLRDGRGPNEEFRAYLLVTMRNAALSSARGAMESLYSDVPEAYLPNPGGDPVENRWDASTAATAFASLPENWRTVLWHTEVEEESPAEIAPLLGMSANGVAALAYRAREGLRQAYLRAHLRDVDGRECQATVSKLAGWVRRSVPVPLGRKISRHLAECADCRARAETLTRVNEELR